MRVAVAIGRACAAMLSAFARVNLCSGVAAGVWATPLAWIACQNAAIAQPLNLDQGAPPPPGAGVAAKEIAGAMAAQVKSIEAGGTLTPVDSVRVALRRAAATLILSGERQGVKGSVHVFMGEAIAARIGVLDGALAGEFATLDAATLRGVAKDLGALGPDASPTNYESAEDADRALREALAPLVQAAGPTMAARGWVKDPRTSEAGPARTDSGGPTVARASLADLAKALALSPEAAASFGELDARLALADRWTAFAGWAGEVRDLVRSAASVAGASRPAWLSDTAYGVLRVELVGAVVGLAGARASEGQHRADRERSMETLRKLAALGELVRAAEAVDATASGRSARTTRAALSELIASPSWGTDASLDERLERVGAALASIVCGAEEVPERTVVRQLRPALASLEPAARQASLQLIDILPRLVRQADATSDPALLGAMSVHARRAADLKLAARVSDLLTGRVNAGPSKRADEKTEIAADHPLRPIAERALLLGQDFAKTTKRDAALAEFRDLAEQLGEYVEIPGERELRAEIQPGNAPGDWASVTGSREKKLVIVLGEARSRWLGERAGPRTQPSARGALRLANFRQAVGFFRDAAAVRAMLASAGDDAAAGPLRSWPGWELSKEALTALCAGLNERTSGLAEKLVAGDDEASARLIQALSKEYAIVPLIARLDRDLREINAASNRDPSGSPIIDALCRIAPGPPSRGAWMAEQRDELASIGRYAEEFVRAGARGDAAASKSLRALVNRAAARVP